MKLHYVNTCYSVTYLSVSVFRFQSQFDDKIQLGPRAQLSWVKGSSGGAKASNSGVYQPTLETHGVFFCSNARV